MTLGERLKISRTKRQMTQEFAAKQLGITFQALSNYERDTRDPDTELLGKMANLYDVTTDFLLLGRTDYRTTSTPVAHKIITPPHIDDELWTEEELMEIERFKNFILSKRKESVHPIHHMAFTTQKTPPATRPTKKPR